MRYPLSFLTLSVLASAFYTGVAIANNGGVHGPNIKADTQSAEFRLNTTATNDQRDGRQQYRIHYQQALNDQWQVRGVLQYRDFGSFEYDNAKLEVLYNYKKATHDDYSAGLRIDFRTRRGDRPEDIAVHWTHQYNFTQQTFARAIAIIDKNVTVNGAGDKPTTIATRFSVSHKFTSSLMVGIELYDNYGKINDIEDANDQQHQIGPMVMYRQDGWYLYARYLHGVTSATADNNFQFRLGKRF